MTTTRQNQFDQIADVKESDQTNEVEIRARIARHAHRGWFQRILDWFYGYDYFISYRWSDGRVYAVALAEKLEQQGFDCFLDSKSYAKGDNWKRIGERALKKTSRLVLIGSPHAVLPDPPREPDKDPVLRELKIFTTTGKRVIPINFDRSLTFTDENIPPLARYLDKDCLWIQEPSAQLSSGPSETTLNDLRNSFDLVRQSEKRARVLRILIAVFAALSVTATAAAIFAFISYRLAEERRVDAEARKLAAQSELLRRAEPGRLDEAVSLARASYLTKPTPEGWEALWNGLQSMPLMMSTIDTPGKPNAIVFSNRGDRAAIGCNDGTLLAISGEGWNQQQRLSIGKPIHSLLFAEEHDLLFLSTDNSIDAVRLSSLKTAWSLSASARPQVLSMTDSGQALAYLDAERCRIVNIVDGQEVRLFAVPGHCRFRGVTNNGSHILLAYRDGPSEGCGLWDLRSAERRWENDGVLQNVLHLAVASPTGRWSAIARGLSPPPNQLVVHDRENVDASVIVLEHHETVKAAAFTQDENGIFTGSSDGTCRLWTLDGREQWRTDLQSPIETLKVLADGALIVVETSDGMLRALDSNSGREWVRANVGAKLESWSVSPDGRFLIVGYSSNHARLWNLESGAVQARYVYQDRGTTKPLSSTADAEVLAIRRSPVSHASQIDSIQFLTSARMQFRANGVEPNLTWIFGTGFNRSGALFATLSQTHVRQAETLELWNSHTGALLDSLPLKGGPAKITISDDGFWLAITWTSRLNGPGSEKAVLWDRQRHRVSVAWDGTWVGGFPGNEPVVSVVGPDGQPRLVNLSKINGWRPIGSVVPTNPRLAIVQGGRADYLEPTIIDNTMARLCFGDWHPQEDFSEIACYGDDGNSIVFRCKIRSFVEQAWLVANEWLVFEARRGFDTAVGVYAVGQMQEVTLTNQVSVLAIDEITKIVTTLDNQGERQTFSLDNLTSHPVSALVKDISRDDRPREIASPIPSKRPSVPLWSDDSRSVATFQKGRVQVYQLNEHQDFVHRLVLPIDERPLAFSSAGRFIAARGVSTVVVYDLRCGRGILSIPIGPDFREADSMPLCFSEENGLMALAQGKNQIRIWDIVKAEELVRLSPQRPVKELWFSERGRSVIVATSDSIERYRWRAHDLLNAAEKRVAPARTTAPALWSAPTPPAAAAK